MTEENFVFDNIALSDLGYIIIHDGVQEEDGVVSGMEYTTVKAARSDLSHKVATPYSENYHVDIEIMKNPCSDGDLNLTNDEISEMARWLCRKEYKWFRWVDEIGQDEIWHEVRITMDKKAYGTDIIGLVLHVESNRPYGLTREYRHEWIGGLSDTTIIVHSDEEGYIYPDVEITVKGGGTVEITNQYEDRTTQIFNCVNGEVIKMYGGDLLQIESNKDHDLSSDFNYKPFRLCNKWGNSKNVIEVSPNANMVFTYRGIRKVGL